MLNKLIQTSDSASLTFLRGILGFVMLAHGAQKMFGWFGGYGFTATIGYFESLGIPAFLGFLAIAAEFFGGIGLLLGFLGRIAAFGILTNMTVAAWMVHRNFFFMNWFGNQQGEGFEYHLLAIGLAWILMIQGSGALSLDRWAGKRIGRKNRTELVVTRAA